MAKEIKPIGGGILGWLKGAIWSVAKSGAATETWKFIAPWVLAMTAAAGTAILGIVQQAPLLAIVVSASIVFAAVAFGAVKVQAFLEKRRNHRLEVSAPEPSPKRPPSAAITRKPAYGPAEERLREDVLDAAARTAERMRESLNFAPGDLVKRSVAGKRSTPRPSFEPDPEFNYPYPKAVLQAEIPNPRGTRSAREDKVWHVGVSLKLNNMHTKPLEDCSVFLVRLVRDGEEIPVNEALRISKGQATFTAQKHVNNQFHLLSRNISDAITPEPFLLKLETRDLPLAENAQYVAELELRSRYPRPTLLTLQIDTGTETDVQVTILEQKIGEEAHGE
ncbi:hypothetical protein [Allosphingosinicella sp.]|uniref:hypothetical protein n=1 Tax=Allosphingosinicella sp. TaxID=2823234 RepID=UPI002F13D405